MQIIKTGLPAEVTLYHPAEFLQLSKPALAFLNLSLEKEKGGLTNQLLVGHIVHYIQHHGLESFMGFARYSPVYIIELVAKAKDKGIDLNQLDKHDFQLNWEMINNLSDDKSVYQSSEGFERASNIYASSNYKMFHRLKFNRKVIWKHVLEIVESIETNDIFTFPLMVYTDIIDGTWKYWIVDGQHRVEAFKLLGLPIRFTLYKKKGGEKITMYDIVQLIASANNTSKKWNLLQYLKVWKSLKIREYEKMSDVLKKTTLALNTLMQAYSGLDRTTASELFMKGKYQMLDEANGDRYVKYLVELQPFLPKGTGLYTSLLNFFRSKEQYDNVVMRQALEAGRGSIIFGETQSDILLTLEGLYSAAQMVA